MSEAPKSTEGAAGASQPTENPSQKKFEPGAIIGDEQLFNKMRAGQMGASAKEMAFLHQMGLLDRLSSQQLIDKAVKWTEKAGEEGEGVWTVFADTFQPKLEERISTLEKQEKERGVPLTAQDAAKLYVGTELGEKVLTEGLGALGRASKNVRGEVWRRIRQKQASRRTSSASQASNASSGGGPGGGEPPSGGGKGSEATPPEDQGPKLDPKVRSYEQVNQDLVKVLHNLETKDEAKIKEELGVLGSYAKKIGVFNDLKSHIEFLQEKYPYLEAAEALKKIDISSFETGAKELKGWDDRLTGIIRSYKSIAFYNMMKAWHDKGGEGSDKLLNNLEIAQLDRIVGLFNYDNPPLDKLRNQAAIILEKGKSKNPKTKDAGQEDYDRLRNERNQAFSPEVENALKEAAGLMREAAIASIQATDAQERMARGEYRLNNLPKEKDEQLEYVRALLNGIENSNRDTHDFAIASLAKSLEASLGDMRPEVAKEVKVRLALHDSSELIKQAGGWIFRDNEKVGHGFSIGSAATEADRRGHAIDREVVKVLLKDGLPGLEVASAWDTLEDANYQYRSLVETLNWREIVNFVETDNNIPAADKQTERERLFNILRTASFNKQNLSQRDAAGNFTQTLRPGERQRIYYLLDRTLKDKLYVTDRDLLPNSKTTEPATNFYSDTDVLRKAKVRELLVKRIAGKESLDDTERAAAEKALQLAEKLSVATLETSVFNRSDAFGNDELAEIIGLKGWRKKRIAAGRNRGPQIHENAIEGFGDSWIRLTRSNYDVNTPLHAADVDLNGIIEGGWAYYSTVLVTRFKQLDGLLLDRQPEPGKVNISALQQMVIHFNTADRPENPEDKTGSKGLRVWWLAGLVDVALANKSLKWDGLAFGELIRAVTKEQLSPEAGTFISDNQWNWIKKVTKFDKRLAKLGLSKGFEAALSRAFSQK